MISVLLTDDPRREKLDAIQVRIDELSAQRAAIAAADLPADELRERCAAAVGKLLEGGHGERPLRLLTKPGPLPALLAHDDEPRDLAAFLAVLVGKEASVNRLVEVASARARYAPGLPAVERAHRLAEIDTESRKLFVAEEVEVYILEAAGEVFVMRRPLPKLDIGAVLNAWDAAEPKLPPTVRHHREVKGDDGRAPPWMTGEDVG